MLTMLFYYVGLIFKLFCDVIYFALFYSIQAADLEQLHYAMEYMGCDWLVMDYECLQDNFWGWTAGVWALSCYTAVGWPVLWMLAG